MLDNVSKQILALAAGPKGHAAENICQLFFDLVSSGKGKGIQKRIVMSAHDYSATSMIPGNESDSMLPLNLSTPKGFISIRKLLSTQDFNSGATVRYCSQPRHECLADVCLHLRSPKRLNGCVASM